MTNLEYIKLLEARIEKLEDIIGKIKVVPGVSIELNGCSDIEISVRKGGEVEMERCRDIDVKALKGAEVEIEDSTPMFNGCNGIEVSIEGECEVNYNACTVMNGEQKND